MGVVQGWRVNEFLPGMKVGRDARVFVSYDTWCDNAIAGAWCQIHSIQAYHCKGNKMKMWTEWKEEGTQEFEWGFWGGC